MSSSMILIVEASTDVAIILKYVLAREGFSVGFARDADEAREIFQLHQAELALMIVDLTSGGFPFVNSIPTLEPRVPVLFVTTHTEDDLRAVAEGGFPYLAKPFKPELIVTMVRHLVSGRQV